MGSVLHFHEPVHLWSMFVRLTELTAAWSVHLRPGCRDYSLSLPIKSEPFQPAALVLCDSACLSELIVSLVSATVCTTQRNKKTTLFNTDSNRPRWVTCEDCKILKLRSCHARRMLEPASCGCSGFLSPFLPSVLDLFVAVALVRGAGIRTGVSLSVAALCSWPVGVGELRSRNFPMRISKIIQCRMGGGLCLSEKWSRNESAKM